MAPEPNEQEVQGRPNAPSEHVCDPSCTHTIDIGPVHVGSRGEQFGVWICDPTCPHPDHLTNDEWALFKEGAGIDE